MKYFDGELGRVLDSDEDAELLKEAKKTKDRVCELSEAGLAVVRGSERAKQRVPGARRPRGAENREARAAEERKGGGSKSTRSKKTGQKSRKGASPSERSQKPAERPTKTQDESNAQTRTPASSGDSDKE